VTPYYRGDGKTQARRTGYAATSGSADSRSDKPPGCHDVRNN
jgi:hypothetical protein